jgi:transposase
MGRTYRAYLPEQDFLLPPSLGDWLPENHLAYFVSDVVEQLDLSAIESVYEEEERGQPPYHLWIISAGLSTISNLLSSVVAKPLSAIHQLQHAC